MHGWAAHTEDEVSQSDFTSTFYREAAQNIPSIADSRDSESEDEEEIVFSNIHHTQDEIAAEQQNAGAKQLQNSAKLQYSWKPEPPGAASVNSQDQVKRSAQSIAQPKGGFPPGHTYNNVPIPFSSGSASNPLHDDNSAAGWLSGAAGLLASARQTSAEEGSSTDAALKADAGGGRLTEEEVEKAFQQDVQEHSSPEPVTQAVQLVTAIHDQDIDRLLQKLVCGELEYNPNDMHSGLPPASSLFTDSEASSEAEEDRAGCAHDTMWSQSIAAPQPVCKQQMQHQPACIPLGSKTAAVNSQPNQDNQKAAQDVRHKSVTGQQPQNTSARLGPFTRHRQSSRLANRFQLQSDYHPENSVAEEFEDWQASRAKIKGKST